MSSNNNIFNVKNLLCMITLIMPVRGYTGTNRSPDVVQDLRRGVLEKSVQKVKNALARDVDPNVQDAQGYTPLMHAVVTGNVVIVELLLNAGADVNKQNEKGMTALMLASESGSLPIVQFLLNKKANVNLKATNGTTALILALNGHARSSESEHIALLLIKEGADVNASDMNGYTPLMGATTQGFIKVVQELMGKGAKINHQGAWGHTALHNAAMHNRPEIMKVMVAQSGININAQDKEGLTPLMYAASKGYDSSVKMLLDAGADVDIKNKKGMTALDWARKNEQSKVEQLLKPIGVSPSPSVPLLQSEPQTIHVIGQISPILPSVTPPPLPPRPQPMKQMAVEVLEQTEPSKFTQTITAQREKILNKQPVSPPQLPPRPQKPAVVTEPLKEKSGARPFSAEDLQKRKETLQKPAPHERRKTKEQILKEQLEKNVMSAPVRSEEKPESDFSDADWD